MKQVKIIDCGVPPLGWQREFGVETPEGIIFKSQGICYFQYTRFGKERSNLK